MLEVIPYIYILDAGGGAARSFRFQISDFRSRPFRTITSMLKPSAHGFLISDLLFPISDRFWTLALRFQLSAFRTPSGRRAGAKAPARLDSGPRISDFGHPISDFRPPISASGSQPSALSLPITEFLQNYCVFTAFWNTDFRFRTSANPKRANSQTSKQLSAHI